MAASSCIAVRPQLAFALAAIFLIVFVHAVTTYEVDAIDANQRNTRTEFEFVPLSEVDPAASNGRVRRQAPTSSSNTLNTASSKSRASSGVAAKSSQKLDKNSAAANSPTDGGVGGQIKNLSSAPDDSALDEKGDYDDQLIADLYNVSSSDTTDEKPRIYHDHHLYYNSTIVLEPQRIEEFWVDLDKMDKVYVHDMLSKSYRRAATVSLTFDFPFYGHILKNATIATGGFLYLGDYMHSWLASTQYIAPLMANFDTRINAESVIKYADNGTDFIVQWEETSLQDYASAGRFTFQARLRNTGDIVFAYSKIPVGVSSIPDSEHPVRIGVSDAYIIDRAMLFHTRKIIYEYHRVEIKKDNIANLTAVYLTALPSCITMKDCESCINTDIMFECTWCIQAKRCSDGMDRFRHEWIYKGCDAASQQLHEPSCPVPHPVLSGDVTESSSSESQSPSPPAALPKEQSKNKTDTVAPTTGSNFDIHDSIEPIGVVTNREQPQPAPHAISKTASSIDGQHSDPVAHGIRQDHQEEEDSSVGAGAVIGIIFLITLIAGLAVWLTYAYLHPHSPSGQMIIRYRPSRWYRVKMEDDYTPATVHI